MFAYELFQKQVEDALRSVGIKEPKLEKPPANIDADLAFPCFSLAKEQKKNPAEIASDLSKKIQAKNLIGKVSAVGPYINFYMDAERFSQAVLNEILGMKEKYGSSDIGKGKNVVVDYSHPNPTHPMGVGHARTTFLGESVARLHEAQGYSLIRLPYVNNMGKQVASLVLAYKKWGNGKKPTGKADVWLYPLYVKFFKEVEKNPRLSEEAEALLKKFEDGDKKVSADFKRIVEWCLQGFKETWKELGIKFDLFPYESAHVKEGKEIVELLKKKGVAKKSQGVIIVDLEKEGLPSTVILRSDGTGLYLTRDIPHLIWRFKTYNPALNLYVVGEDQALYFRQLFKTIELLGYKDWAKRSVHLKYASVNLKGKRMSARRGIIVLLDDLLADGTKLAMVEVKKRWPKLSEKEKVKRAKQIALAAIVYYILKYSPERFVNFDWKSALAFEGETGPYMQYSYVRANSILKKAKSEGKITALKEREELALVNKLAQFPEIVSNAAKQLSPHILANYLFILAQDFNLFYEKYPVLKAEKDIKENRLALVSAVAQVLKNGLNILNISAPERM